MGAQNPPDMDDVGIKATHDSRPIHRIYVDGFFMDTTDVTNGQSEKFVKATGYVTVAERKPRAEDYPGAPPESLVAGSVVFAPPDHPVALDNYFEWWTYVPSAGQGRYRHWNQPPWLSVCNHLGFRCVMTLQQSKSAQRVPESHAQDVH